jgi:predicted small lipoprotein YifL
MEPEFNAGATMRIPYVLAVLLLLAGCASREPVRSPPSSTSAQIEQEMQHLQQHFFTDSCMAQLRKAAPELKPGAAQQGGKTLYAVEFPPNSAVRDGLAYQLHVKAQGRLAYLYVSDGTAGSYRIHGPLPLGACLNDRLP